MRQPVAENSIVPELASRALYVPVREFVDARGKKLRSAMVHLSYTIAGGCHRVPDEILQAVEWLHAGSLVIDDVQDDSAHRRGRPTLHRIIGIPLAINAGNFMYFQALEMVTTANLPEHVRLRVTSEMIRAACVCHEGQAIDLAAQVDHLRSAHWVEVAESIALQKTGMLVGLAMRLGAVGASAESSLVEELGRCGCQIGLALQMRNDLDELAKMADAFLTGSELSRVDDLRNLRITWPWAWLSKSQSASVCERLALRLRTCAGQDNDGGLGELATELWSFVHEFGELEIKQRIEEPIRMLGEHVVDASMLQALRECLIPIERGTRESVAVKSNLTAVPL